MTQEDGQVVGDAEQARTQQQNNKIFCPCCGQRTFNKTTKIDQQLLNHYLSCLLTGTQFWRDYSLYDGKLRIRAVIPSYQRARDLDLLLKQLQAPLDPQQRKQTAAMFEELQFILRRLLSIDQIQIRDPQGTGNRVIKRTYQVVLQALKQGATADTDMQRLKDVLNTAYAYVRDAHTGIGLPFALLSSVADAHALIYNTIISAGLDENFWRGIKLT